MTQTTLNLKYELTSNSPKNVLRNFLTDLEILFENSEDNEEIKKNLINLYFEFVIKTLKVIFETHSFELKYEDMNKPKFLTPLILLQITFFYKVIVEKKIYFSRDEIKNYLNSYLNNNLLDNKFFRSVEKIIKHQERFMTKLRLLYIVCVLFSVLYEIDTDHNDVKMVVNEIFRRLKIEKNQKVKDEVKFFTALLIFKDNRFNFLKEYFKIID